MIPKTYISAVFLGIVLLFSCAKKEDPLDDPNMPVIGNLPELGTLSFKYNGVEYENFTASALLDTSRTTFGLRISKRFYPQIPVEENINFLRIPLAKGEYELNSSYSSYPVSYSLTVIDEDAVGDWFYIDTTVSTNLFKINTIDTVAKTVSGTFEAKFLAQTTNNTWYNWPKVIDITEGKFYLEYK